MDWWTGGWKTETDPWGAPDQPPPSPSPQPSRNQRQVPLHNLITSFHVQTLALKRSCGTGVSRKRARRESTRYCVWWNTFSFFFSRGPFQSILNEFQLLFASPPIGGSRCPAMPRRRAGSASCPWDSGFIQPLGQKTASSSRHPARTRGAWGLTSARRGQSPLCIERCL